MSLSWTLEYYMSMETLFFIIYFHYIYNMNETILINSLLFFLFFMFGVRFGKNMEKLKEKKDDEH
jgi:hypothetical protein